MFDEEIVLGNVVVSNVSNDLAPVFSNDLAPVSSNDLAPVSSNDLAPASYGPKRSNFSISSF